MPPLDPNYRYADETHPRMRESGLYACHNHQPRRTTSHWAPAGWHSDGRRRVVLVATKWNPVDCGHDELSGSDPRCVGCRWRVADEGGQG